MCDAGALHVDVRTYAGRMTHPGGICVKACLHGEQVATGKDTSHRGRGWLRVLLGVIPLLSAPLSHRPPQSLYSSPVFLSRPTIAIATYAMALNTKDNSVEKPWFKGW